MKCFLILALSLCACVGPRAGDDVGAYQAGVRVCADGETVRGIDVSHWDETIDWNKVKADNVAFAFIKATQGTTFVDSEFATNWAGTKQAGVIRGAYHFFEPGIDGAAQADFFVATAGVPEAGDFAMTLDLEKTDVGTKAEIAARALAFLERVEALTGRVPIVYTSARVFDTELGTPAGFSKYPLWNANYTTLCPNISQPTWETWTFWQNTDKAMIDGITTGCDQNFFNGSMAALQAFVSGTPVMPDASAPLDLAPSTTPDLGAPVDLATTHDAASIDEPPLHRGLTIYGGCTVGDTTPTLFSLVILLGTLLWLRTAAHRSSRV